MGDPDGKGAFGHGKHSGMMPWSVSQGQGLCSRCVSGARSLFAWADMLGENRLHNPDPVYIPGLNTHLLINLIL